MGSRFWVSTSAAAAALLALPLTVVAQDANEAQDGEETERLDAVIVTSTRREELLQDVPLAVTVLSQEELDEKGVVGYEGLAAETTGVVLNRASANFNNFTARGRDLPVFFGPLITWGRRVG